MLSDDYKDGLPLKIVPGVNFELDVLYVSKTEQGVESVIDLTGYTAEMWLRTNPGSGEEPELSLSTTDATIVITGTSGLIRVNAPVSLTEDISVEWSGYYDLIVTAEDGRKDRVLYGPIEASRGGEL